MSRPSPANPHRKRTVLLIATSFVLLALAFWFLIWSPQQRPHRPPSSFRSEPELTRFERERALMGTSFRVVVYASTEHLAEEALASAFNRAREIATICSDYDPESELSRLSHKPVGRPIAVSDTLATILAHAQLTAEATEGAFDPTIGPLSRLWRQSSQRKKLPDRDELDRALQSTGWRHLSVDHYRKIVTLHKAGMILDLGGIAKGYAADEMYEHLRQHGLPIAFVAAGGDIRLGNPPPGEDGWKVGLRTQGPSPSHVIRVSNCAVSTSGDLHQHVEIDGTRYSHIIDPSTGLGLTRQIAATIIAPRAVQSDPYATFACISPNLAYASFEVGDISLRVVAGVADSRQTHQTLNFPPVEKVP